MDKNKATDLNRAMSYYEKGVALGNPDTAWNLAALYGAHEEKLGRSRSYYTKEMAKLMTLAADSGLLEAQLALASSYATLLKKYLIASSLFMVPV